MKSLRYEAVSRRGQKRMRGAGELSKTQTAQGSRPHAQPCLIGLSVGPHLPQIVVIIAPVSRVLVWEMSVV